MAVVFKNSSISSLRVNNSIIDDGLVMFYDVANPVSYQSGSSNITDLSSSDLGGALVNDPTFNLNPLYFTGFEDDEYVGTTNTGWTSVIPTGNSERTIICAFRTPNVFTKNYYHILHYGAASNRQSYGFAVWTNAGSGNIGSSNADGVLGNHTWNGTFYADFDLQNNTDYIGAIRYRDTDSPRSSIWISGNWRTVGFGQGETADYSINTGTTFAPRLGNRISTPSEPLGPGGRIYSVLFYDRYLSDNEVTQITDTVGATHGIS